VELYTPHPAWKTGDSLLPVDDALGDWWGFSTEDDSGGGGGACCCCCCGGGGGGAYCGRWGGGGGGAWCCCGGGNGGGGRCCGRDRRISSGLPCGCWRCGDGGGNGARELLCPPTPLSSGTWGPAPPRRICHHGGASTTCPPCSPSCSARWPPLAPSLTRREPGLRGSTRRGLDRRAGGCRARCRDPYPAIGVAPHLPDCQAALVEGRQRRQDRNVAELICLNYSGLSALVIIIQAILTQHTSNGTTHWSVGSPPDSTTVTQDRGRFTSHEGEFTITQQLTNF
jgi:hypothetical protein